MTDLGPRLILGPDHPLTCDTLERAACTDAPHVDLSAKAREEMDASADALDHLVASGAEVYGLTTGFGPHVAHASASGGAAAHGAGLVAHLGAGWGAPAPPEAARATMMVRAQQTSQGFSGLRPHILDAYLSLLHGGLVPFVPAIGSVGASGDLTPLAHVARLLMGDGFALDTRTGERIPAAQALESAGIEPLALTGREALALVNGTSFMTAYLALAVQRAERLVARAESLVAWSYRLLGCRREALDPRLHAARGHAGQAESARNILREIHASGDAELPHRPLQEIYALRCAPQILGACRENLDHARRLAETEMNGVSDNPVIVRDPEPAALHGGNFQGQQIAFAADALNAALTQVAVHAERLIDAVTDPKREVNDGAPLLLAWEPGPTSGLAGAQMTATAVTAEMRHHAQMAATSSIPTNGGNQDIVSMGTLAARTAYEQAERLSPVLAVLGLSLSQLTFLRANGRASGEAVALPDWMPEVEGLVADRALYDDIGRVARAWLAPEAPAPRPASVPLAPEVTAQIVSGRSFRHTRLLAPEAVQV